jgi:hypothetical protein
MNFLQLPTDVLLYAGRLSATQLLIWADAWTFKKNTGKAYRTNAQLSEMLNVTERSVSRAVQELIKMNAITVQSNGRNRVIDANPPAEWKVDTNVHRRRRPPTQTSTDADVHADPTDVSMQGGHERPCRLDTDVPLIEKRIEKEKKKGIEKSESEPEIEIVMPWESDYFTDAWREWKEYKRIQKRFKYASPKYEQIALHQLHENAEGNEHLAVFAIATSIANGWSGIFINAQLKREFSKRERSRGSDELTPEYLHWVKTGEWLPHSV